MQRMNTGLFLVLFSVTQVHSQLWDFGFSLETQIKQSSVPINIMTYGKFHFNEQLTAGLDLALTINSPVLQNIGLQLTYRLTEHWYAEMAFQERFFNIDGMRNEALAAVIGFEIGGWFITAAYTIKRAVLGPLVTDHIWSYGPSFRLGLRLEILPGWISEWSIENHDSLEYLPVTSAVLWNRHEIDLGGAGKLSLGLAYQPAGAFDMTGQFLRLILSAGWGYRL